MKLAILGADPATLALAVEILADPRHDLVGVCEPGTGDESGPLIEIARHTQAFDNWESLLDAALVDGVVVSSGNEDYRADQLRKFSQAGMPVLVAHPVFASMLVYYELDMIRRDTRSVMLPYLPWRRHPAIVALAEFVELGPAAAIGKAEQLVIERQLFDRSQAAVKAQFARDVDLIRAITGEVTRLGAMGGSDAPSTYASLGVQLSGSAGVVSRWSIVPAEAEESARLVLVGAAGKATVELPAEGPHWRCAVAVGGNQLVREAQEPYWQPAHDALDAFAAAVHGHTSAPDWVDASRSAELAESIGRSLAKGRTIEMLYEDYTEQGTFKGKMTSLGCGLLLAGLGILVLVALAEDFARGLNQQIRFVSLWPYLLLGLLAIFLLLQLLTLLFHGDRRDPPVPPDA